MFNLDDDDDFLMRRPRASIALVMTLAALTCINSTGATYTCATGSFDPNTNTIKYPNQRRQKTITINGVAYSADLIEQAATNLLGAGTSERFGVTWTVGTGTPTVTDAATTGVAGETDAASFIEGSANGEQSLRQSITKAASALGYTGSIYVKNASGTRKVVVELDDGTTTNGVSLIMNPSTGAIVSAPAAFGAGWSVLTAAMPTGYKIEAAGTYWRVSLAATSDATTTVRFRVALYDGSTTSYAGDSTSGIYVWGAQVCNCNWACSHISNRNAITRSEDWSSSWFLARTTTTANSVANPLGGDVTATFLKEDNTVTSTHSAITATRTVVATTMTYSGYAKANGRNWIVFAIGSSNTLTNSAGAYFDLQNGVTGNDFTNGTGWALSSKSITSVGNGWYRCKVTVVVPATTAAVGMRLASANGTSSYTGDATSGCYIYGMQWEYGSAATTYWATNSSGSGVRALGLLLSTATLDTTAGTLLGLMIPYGWSGHFNNSTVYRVISSQATAANGEIRCTTGAASNSLTGTRTDAAAASLGATWTASPTIVDGTLIQLGYTWGSGFGAGIGSTNGIFGSSSDTAVQTTQPLNTVTGTSIGPISGTTQPNAYVLGFASAVQVPGSYQQAIFANAVVS